MDILRGRSFLNKYLYLFNVGICQLPDYFDHTWGKLYPVLPHDRLLTPTYNMEDNIMQQLIPEHPASYAADAAVVIFLLLTVFFMTLVW